MDEKEGITLLKNMQKVRQRTYTIPSVQDERKGRAVALVENGSVLISGSDHGLIYLFNRRAATTDKLKVAEGQDWVQTFEVSPRRELSRNGLIASFLALHIRRDTSHSHWK